MDWLIMRQERLLLEQGQREGHERKASSSTAYIDGQRIDRNGEKVHSADASKHF